MVELPSVSTHAQQFEQHLITIFSLLLLCGPTESRFSGNSKYIAKHLRRKKNSNQMRYFSFTRKPDELNFFFPLTSLDSFGFLVYLSVFCFVYFFTSLRDSTHPEHMQVPWFTLPRYTPSLSYIGRSISPSFPYLKEEENK